MNKDYKRRFIGSVFITLISIISASSNLLFRISNVFHSFEKTNVEVLDVQYSIFYLIIITNNNTYKIVNTATIIAILGMILLIGQIINYRKKDKLS